MAGRQGWIYTVVIERVLKIKDLLFRAVAHSQAASDISGSGRVLECLVLG